MTETLRDDLSADAADNAAVLVGMMRERAVPAIIDCAMFDLEGLHELNDKGRAEFLDDPSDQAAHSAEGRVLIQQPHGVNVVILDAFLIDRDLVFEQVRDWAVSSDLGLRIQSDPQARIAINIEGDHQVGGVFRVLGSFSEIDGGGHTCRLSVAWEGTADDVSD